MISQEKITQLIEQGVLTQEEADQLSTQQFIQMQQEELKKIMDQQKAERYSEKPAYNKLSPATNKPWTDWQVEYHEQIQEQLDDMDLSDAPKRFTDKPERGAINRDTYLPWSKREIEDQELRDRIKAREELDK